MLLKIPFILDMALFKLAVLQRVVEISWNYRNFLKFYIILKSVLNKFVYKRFKLHFHFSMKNVMQVLQYQRLIVDKI
jgi:hypothetical protein